MASGVSLIRNGLGLIGRGVKRTASQAGTNLVNSKAAAEGLATDAFGGFKSAVGNTLSAAFGSRTKAERAALNSVKKSINGSLNYYGNNAETYTGFVRGAAGSIYRNAGKNAGRIASAYKGRAVALGKVGATVGGVGAVGGIGYSAMDDR